jgi:hypothetical protein
MLSQIRDTYLNLSSGQVFSSNLAWNSFYFECWQKIRKQDRFEGHDDDDYTAWIILTVIYTADVNLMQKVIDLSPDCCEIYSIRGSQPMQHELRHPTSTA